MHKLIAHLYKKMAAVTKSGGYDLPELWSIEALTNKEILELMAVRLFLDEQGDRKTAAFDNYQIWLIRTALVLCLKNGVVDMEEFLDDEWTSVAHATEVEGYF